MLGGMGTPTRTIHLVRHAKAGSRSKWNEDDSERPLTEAGVGQSEALAERLSTSARGPLFSSRYLRCRQTLEPLASRLDAHIEIVDWLTEGSGGHLAFENLSRLPDGSVMCSHGDVITDLMEMFLRRDIPVEPTPANVRKASELEISIDDGNIVAVRYLEPPRAHDDGSETDEP